MSNTTKRLKIRKWWYKEEKTPLTYHQHHTIIPYQKHTINITKRLKIHPSDVTKKNKHDLEGKTGFYTYWQILCTPLTTLTLLMEYFILYSYSVLTFICHNKKNIYFMFCFDESSIYLCESKILLSTFFRLLSKRDIRHLVFLAPRSFISWDWRKFTFFLNREHWLIVNRCTRSLLHHFYSVLIISLQTMPVTFS